MSPVLPWMVLLLGIGHLAYGGVVFKTPLRDAFREGFVGRFGVDHERRTALWFMLFGFLLLLAGHAALHAVSVADTTLLRLVSSYLLGTSLLGWAALPKSPFLASALLSAALATQSWMQP